MPEPKTILEYATKRNTDADQRVTDTQQQLAQAQTDLNQINTDRQDTTAKLAKLEAQAADIRQKLSTVATPADGVALLDKLEQATVRIRETQATIVQIQQKFSIIQARVTKAQTDLAAATAEQQAASAALAQATASEARLEALRTALTDPPLADIKTEAGKALDEANPVDGLAFKKAKERIDAMVPARLSERARARREQAKAVIVQEERNTLLAEDAILKESETNGGVAGAAAKAWVAFKRAETAATDFVNNSQNSFGQAKSALAQVGDPNQSPLTPEQKERINDPALKDDREEATQKESDLHTGLLQDVINKQKDLDEKILKAKADPSSDPQDVITAQEELNQVQGDYNAENDLWHDAEIKLIAAFDKVEQMQLALAEAIKKAVVAGNDPDTDPDVGTAKGNLTNAENDLKGAESEYKDSFQGKLDLWEAAVPDSTWRLFDKYEDAVESLKALKDSDPAALNTNLKNREEAYVTAQLAADKSRNILAQLTSEQAQRAAREQGARQTADARLFSALRGDE